MNRIVVIAICLMAGTVGCQTAPTRYHQLTQGNWQARALIKDLAQGRSYIVNLGFNVIRDDKTRMDVTTAIGTGVASLVVDEKEVRYILVDSKRFYFGTPQVDVMRPILAIPFDPRWIQNMLFDEPIADKGWLCQKDSSGWLASCEAANSDLKVTWSGRKGDRKSILISHPKATVQININSFRPKVQERSNLFDLESPEGYQKFRIR